VNQAEVHLTPQVPPFGQGNHSADACIVPGTIAMISFLIILYPHHLINEMERKSGYKCISEVSSFDMETSPTYISCKTSLDTDIDFPFPS